MSAPRARCSAASRRLAPLLLAITLLVTCGERTERPRARPPRFGLGVGENVTLVGGGLAERMQHHGWLETLLQDRFPWHELSFRNLGFSADELTIAQRTAGFPDQDDYLELCRTSVVLAFFGYNESFRGREGLDAFRRDLEAFLDRVRSRRYDGANPPRVVLFSSIPYESPSSSLLPDGVAANERIALYNAVIADAAAHEDVFFVDLFEPMRERYAAAARPLTINGIHLTEEGNRVLAEIIDAALFPPRERGDASRLGEIRRAVVEKSRLWFNRYRATDGYNVYGGRSNLKYTDDVSNRDVLQREMKRLDALAERHTEHIWSIARGSPEPVDLDGLPRLQAVKTNKPGDGPGGAHRFVAPEASVSMMTAAEGLEVSVFADEQRFPELANPVQMSWDPAGRLWVAVWPTYPHWAPGRPMNDKLLVLTDEDGDGRADECRVFAGGLHNPTGFELWNGGVIVANAPDLLFLKDEDGDGRADVRRRILHGLSSADTHHSANSFVLGPDGALYFQEGVFHQSQIETIHGPVRNHDACVWRFEPRTWRVERHVAFDFANPHGHVFDRWGQDFVTDGTGNVNYYALPFSGRVVHPDKHRPYFPFFEQRCRPCAGTEILSSRLFPTGWQGSYLVANVIGFQGILQYRVEENGSGFGATEVEPIVFSDDPSFRPSDIEMGPDGAIYFLDWYNPLIGHMQHHLRDPSRDHTHGRVYRVAPEGARPAAPVRIAGRPVGELVALLAEPEDRVRYRVRIELSARPTPEVAAAARSWAAALDEGDPRHDHHLTEALWLLQQHGVADEALLRRALKASDPRARAAATRVVRGLRRQLRAPLELLAEMAADEHPRVRLEAVVAASFFDEPAAAALVLEAMRHPTDRFLDYAIDETMRTLEPVWKEAIERGELLDEDNPRGVELMLSRLEVEEIARLPRIPPVLEALLHRHGIEAGDRRAAAETLAAVRGVGVGAIVVEAVRHVDASRGPHARHVLMGLGSLLQRLSGEDAPPPEQLVGLAKRGKKLETKAAALAAWAARSGSVEDAWTLAAATPDGLEAFLAAVPQLRDTRLREASYGRARRAMFGQASALDGAKPGRDGLRVAYYGEAPKDVALETLAAMEPQVVGTATSFSLDIDEVLRRDGFALSFSGTLEVTAAGRYRFGTRSDDGSRLYLDGRLVVDNDGDHSMAEASGEIELGAGAHAITVTFYDRGGAEGLEVWWEGPGIARQGIPDDRLTIDPSLAVRAAAVRAVASISGHAAEKLADAASLIGEGRLVTEAVELVRSVPAEQRPASGVAPLISSIAALVSSLPPARRSAPDVLAALELGREVAAALPAPEAESARRMLGGLGGSVVLVRTLPHRMLYDRKDFAVQRGRPVAIVFQNNDVMPHNFVITRPGRMEAVGRAAEGLGASAASSDYVPPGDDVLWHTPLLYPGQTARLELVAPDVPGDYPFVCTFPGHWRVMNGVMHVVEELSAADRAVAPAGRAEAASSRKFVRMWTYDDLVPALAPGWQQACSLASGRRLFTEAGCARCHAFGDVQPANPVDLTKIADKYEPRQILRHILEPSRAILEGFESYIFTLRGGRTATGRIVKDDGVSLHVAGNLQEPDELERIRKLDIAEKLRLKTSMMPTGLLVTLTESEILDLLAFLESGGS